MAYDLNNQTHIHQLFLFKANDTMNVELVDFSPLLTGLFIFLYRHVFLKINILTLTDKQTLTNTRTRTPNSKPSTCQHCFYPGCGGQLPCDLCCLHFEVCSYAPETYTKSVHTQMIAKQEFTRIVHCSVEIQNSTLSSYENHSKTEVWKH